MLIFIPLFDDLDKRYGILIEKVELPHTCKPMALRYRFLKKCT